MRVNRALAGVSRREFLVTVPIISCSLGGLIRTSALAITLQSDKTRDEIRNKLLELVNAERFLAGVSELEFDDLANRVATAHATDMAAGKFISHWGRDGLKPYHRYSFAGGIHATQENIASIDNFYSADWKDLAEDLIMLHVKMHSEKPPRDGHRKTILAPQHTHVGFGFAASERRLRLVELYVAKYLEVFGFKSQATLNESFQLTGRLLNDKHRLQQIDIFYEPRTVLREGRVIQGSYGLPDEYESLRPKLGQRWYYEDGSKGDIEVKKDGRFQVPVKLFKSTPGIYTIVCWVKTNRSEKPFPATEICIETD